MHICSMRFRDYRDAGRRLAVIVNSEDFRARYVAYGASVAVFLVDRYFHVFLPPDARSRGSSTFSPNFRYRPHLLRSLRLTDLN